MAGDERCPVYETGIHAWNRDGLPSKHEPLLFRCACGAERRYVAESALKEMEKALEEIACSDKTWDRCIEAIGEERTNKLWDIETTVAGIARAALKAARSVKQ